VDYLLKPLVPEILRSKVSAFVDLFRKTLRVAEQAEQLRELERQCHRAELAEAQRQLEIARLQQDMRAARQVQQILFPRQAPFCPGFDIAGVSYPADETGGDYYDYIPSCDGCLDVVIGDVSGHGLPAALLMSSTRAYLRALALANLCLGEVLATANRALAADTEIDRFITLLYVRVSPAALSLRYLSAGHPTGYVLSRDGQVRATLESISAPLGIFAEEEFPESGDITLQRGDTLLFMTDGVTEVCAPDGRSFGEDRALEIIRQNQTRPAHETLDALYDAVKEFAACATLEDDFTAIVIKVQ
jgi:sigma-B regulation protein RsbU (phosphoserine phosphatase)